MDHPPPFSAEVTERVELSLYSPSGPSWPVLGWTLLYLLTLLYFTLLYLLYFTLLYFTLLYFTLLYFTYFTVLTNSYIFRNMKEFVCCTTVDLIQLCVLFDSNCNNWVVMQRKENIKYLSTSLKTWICAINPFWQSRIYTGCFTTLGHNCRRWFPRSLWWKKFI